MRTGPFTRDCFMALNQKKHRKLNCQTKLNRPSENTLFLSGVIVQHGVHHVALGELSSSTFPPPLGYPSWCFLPYFGRPNDGCSTTTPEQLYNQVVKRQKKVFIKKKWTMEVGERLLLLCRCTPNHFSLPSAAWDQVSLRSIKSTLCKSS